MDKRDFFVLGLKKEMYKNKAWVNRVFSLVQETKTKETMKPYEIMQSMGGFFYKDPEKDELEPITGIEMGMPMYKASDPITIKAGELPGFDQDTDTKAGRVLYHCIVFVYPFGNKVKFTNKPLSMGGFEGELARKLKDDEEDPSKEDPKFFYPHELIKYYEAVAYTRSLSMLFVPAASPKTLTIDDEIIRRRDELFNDPKIDMNDPVTAAAVESELAEMDRKSFENDPASGFLIGGKDFKVVRKKRFISSGSSDGLVNGTRTEYIKKSLNEGFDRNMMKSYVDGMRNGSYKRGVETSKGGEMDKWLVRASSNIRVVIGDCGSKIGIPDIITDSNKLDKLGINIVDNGKTVAITEDNIGSYLGKAIIRRSPAACLTKAPDYCSTCLGAKLSMNPDAISLAFSHYGNDFMYLSMKAMHGKALALAKMDLVEEAS